MNSSENSRPLRDPWQVTFVMLNRFRSLSRNPFIHPSSPIILSILNGQYQAAWNANRKFWEGTSVKSYKTQLPVFLFVLHYISRYHFHNFLEFHSSLSEKKIFPKFFFFNGFTPSPQPQPFNGQNLLNMTKVYCRFFLKCLLKYFFFVRFIEKILERIF